MFGPLYQKDESNTLLLTQKAMWLTHVLRPSDEHISLKHLHRPLPVFMLLFYRYRYNALIFEPSLDYNKPTATNAMFFFGPVILSSVPEFSYLNYIAELTYPYHILPVNSTKTKGFPVDNLQGVLLIMFSLMTNNHYLERLVNRCSPTCKPENLFCRQCSPIDDDLINGPTEHLVPNT